MTTAARDIIFDAQNELQDLRGVRWPATTLVGYLNDGQVAVATKRPDQVAKTVATTLAAGVRQALPAQAFTLLDIPRNSTGRKRAVTKVDQILLDQTAPEWQSGPAASEIRHFCYDLREPRVFLVYPPASALAQVDLQYAEIPAAVSAPTGRAYSDVTGDIALPDQWRHALRYYVLYRAWSVGMEAGGDASLATANYQLFKAELGEQLDGAASVAPQK